MQNHGEHRWKLSRVNTFLVAPGLAQRSRLELPMGWIECQSPKVEGHLPKLEAKNKAPRHGTTTGMSPQSSSRYQVIHFELVREVIKPRHRKCM